MKNRTQWVSVFMALAMPGLGQVYNGELIKGCCILVFFSVLPLLLSWIGLKVIGTAPLIWAVLAVITGLLVYILAVAEAFRRRKERPNLFPSAFQTRLFYLAFWLVAMIFIAVVQQYIRDHLVEAYRIVSHSMSPTVLAGDYVLVDKVFYVRGPVRKGILLSMFTPMTGARILSGRLLPCRGMLYQTGRTKRCPMGLSWSEA